MSDNEKIDDAPVAGPARPAGPANRKGKAPAKKRKNAKGGRGGGKQGSIVAQLRAENADLLDQLNAQADVEKERKEEQRRLRARALHLYRMEHLNRREFDQFSHTYEVEPVEYRLSSTARLVVAFTVAFRVLLHYWGFFGTSWSSTIMTYLILPAVGAFLSQMRLAQRRTLTYNVRRTSPNAWEATGNYDPEFGTTDIRPHATQIGPVADRGIHVTTNFEVTRVDAASHDLEIVFTASKFVTLYKRLCQPETVVRDMPTSVSALNELLTARGAGWFLAQRDRITLMRSLSERAATMFNPCDNVDAVPNAAMIAYHFLSSKNEKYRDVSAGFGEPPLA